MPHPAQTLFPMRLEAGIPWESMAPDRTPRKSHFHWKYKPKRKSAIHGQKSFKLQRFSNRKSDKIVKSTSETLGIHALFGPEFTSAILL